MTTPNLALPEMIGNQAQPHLTINQALRMLDALAQVSCIAQQNAPPVSPVDGDRYLVGSAATGDWATHEQELAAYIGTGWVFSTPQEGWLVWLRSEGALYIYGTTSPAQWEELQTGGTGIATDAIWTEAGELVYGTGVGTAAVLSPPAYEANLQADGAGGLTWEATALPPGQIRYIQGFFPGIPGADQLIWAHQVNSVMEFYVADMQAQARVPPGDTSGIEIVVKVSGTRVGVILVDAAGYGYGVDDGTAVNVATGGAVIEFYAPTVPDSAMADIALVGFETL